MLPRRSARLSALQQCNQLPGNQQQRFELSTVNATSSLQACSEAVALRQCGAKAKASDRRVDGQASTVDEAATPAVGAPAAPASPAAPAGGLKRKRAASKAKGPDRRMEQSVWSRGFKHVYGVDEAGRGPLAGPVVAAACAVPAGLVIPGLDDSKKLSEEQREEIFDAIVSNPDIFYAVDIVGPAEIDRVNILQATIAGNGQHYNEGWGGPQVSLA
ncbi:hypothetical protein CLOP_g8061 [Closterium sp. NIES-67]|nr:hypothetical protein CLOP_g8061 [Closterium sp. NIES-67]